MSVFATLRRKRDKSKGAPSHGTTLVSEAKAEPIFNSTPNLHKINPTVKLPPTAFRKKKESSAVFYPDASEDVIVEDDDEERYGGFGSRRSSSAADTGGSGSGKYGKNKGSGSGSLRHFASMISMFGSLKRTKSSRKMSYGSTQTFEAEKPEGKDFMRDRVHGKSPDPELHSSKSAISSSQPSTESTTCLCDGDTGNGKTNLTDNTEPGVRSSSSSDDDDSRRNSLMDNLNKSSSIVVKNEEPNFDYTNTKTEEELKRTKFIIQGVKKFNMDHKKGIQFLIDHDIVQNTSEDVAKFLKYGEGLSKKAIGNYLGEHIEFNEEVLQTFLDLHDFKDLILVQALREFLWSFRLPGEAQKIDRMMEAFAKRYCQSNPGIFTSSDTCYLLSYSIIMLNTLLHNPSVKDKPTLERFVLMNRDVDSGKSLNKAFLVHLYNSILAEPFKIPPEDANDLVLTFFNPDIEGWLWKQGGYKTWKRRWFILSNNCLYYFKFTTDKSPRGIIPLENVNAKEVSSNKSNELYPFILYKKSSSSMPSDVIKTCKTLSNGTTVLSQYHTITVASINQEDRRKWVQSINQNNSNSDFYDVLTIKKRNLEAARQHHTREQRSGTPPPSAVNTPRVRKSLISQPSTAPTFEYKDKLTPELLAPAGPRKDPNNYFKNCTVFSSSASISSGSAIEPDSSYGSFSDISRSRSESRIIDCSRDGSISSVEHDTGSLGSRGNVAEERSPRSLFGSDKKPSSFDSEFICQDVKYDLPKKLSVIEESQNQSDRSSSSSGANMVDEDSNSHPICIGYRKLSEEIYEGYDVSHSRGASYSDSANCDNSQTPYKRNTKCPNVDTSKQSMHKILSVTEELSTSTKITKIGDEKSDDVLTSSSTTVRYSRSGSLESDV